MYEITNYTKGDRSSDYEGYLPKYNDGFKYTTGYTNCKGTPETLQSEEDFMNACEAIYETYDRNSIYLDTHDEYTPIEHYDIYINAWFVDEVE